MQTKDGIADAFVSTACRKGADKVTVSDLANALHMTRQTFYYHFDDIPDLLRYLVRRKTEALIQMARTDPDRGATLQSFVEFADENDELVHKLLNSHYHDVVDDSLFRFLCELLRELPIRASVGRLPRKEREFLITYNAYAVKDILIYWRKENKLSTAEAVSMVQDFLTDRLITS